jgi:flavodoxin
MKILVTYMSQTGNTQKIATAISEQITCDKDVKKLEEVDNVEEYDLIFIGFPVWQFGTPEPVKKHLDTKFRGKDVAIFVTHGMLSTPNNQKLPEILKVCKTAVKGANILGFFNCTGALSEAAADIMMKSNNPMLQKFAGIRQHTIEYPRQQEIEEAKDFASKLVQELVS